MRVKDLIRELKELHPDMEIVFREPYEEHCDFPIVDVIEDRLENGVMVAVLYS